MKSDASIYMDGFTILILKMSKQYQIRRKSQNLNWHADVEKQSYPINVQTGATIFRYREFRDPSHTSFILHLTNLTPPLHLVQYTFVIISATYPTKAVDWYKNFQIRLLAADPYKQLRRGVGDVNEYANLNKQLNFTRQIHDNRVLDSI